MTGVILILAIISLNLTFISDYLRRICKCLEDKKNSDDEKGDAE